MLKILMITESLIKGGKERRLVELLRFFENQDIDIKITLVLLKKILQYDEIDDFKKVRVIVLPRKIKKDPTVFFKLLRIYRDFRPDIIHSWGSMPSVYSFAIAKLYGRPFLNAMIADAFCKTFNKNWIRTKITFPFSDLIISNSLAGLKAYHVPASKGRVIYNGFNFDRLENINSREEEFQRLGIKTKYVVGMIGAFHPRKDYATYLEGARKICGQNNDITFLAIGDGMGMDYFREKYRDVPQIIFTGRIDKVESIISILDVGVLLTDPKTHFEGISNAIIEMMAFSKTIIATKGGGTDELIENGKSGILINPYSVSELVDNILMILNNTNKYKEMGINARKKIAADFNIDKMGKETLGLYNELINK